MLLPRLVLAVAVALSASAQTKTQKPATMPGHPAAGAKPVDFTRDVRPILSENCFFCHGPDEATRKAKLRLDTKEGAFASKGVIVAGDPATSRIMRRLLAKNDAVRMPPPASHRTVTPDQIELIRRWIEQGAKWDTHWAYVTPKRPEMPVVKDEKWARNPIDRFILARLEREGLQPSPEADKTTLIRRVSFDLTGLPPSPAEVKAFVDDKSSDAYEKVVDRLLGSEQYGERMAMQWLDLARYADTHGFHIDSHRDMWPWRDWVIRAFNANMPFDQFTVQQLAGDLLSKPTREQRIATGFNRNHMINFEGGAIPEEYLTEYVVDRVETTSAVWMGMTMGCARCHDHKYDPIKQKEFYQFYSFFNNVKEKGLDGRAGNAEPFLRLTTPEQQAALDELDGTLEAKEWEWPENKVAKLQADWEKTKLASLPDQPREGLLAHFELDGNLADSSGGYLHGRAVRGEVTYGEGGTGRGAEFSGETHVQFAPHAPVDRDRPFSIAVWFKPGGVRATAPLQKIDLANGRRGYELMLDEAIPIGDLRRGANVIFRLTHRWPDQAIEIRTRERLGTTSKDASYKRSWRHAAVTYDGSGKASGLKLYIDGQPVAVDILCDNLTGSFANEAPLEIGSKLAGDPYKGQIDDIRVYSRALTDAELDTIAVHLPIRTLLSDNTSKRSKDQRQLLREYFLAYDAPEPIRALHQEMNRLERKRAELEKTILTTMVMSEEFIPRPTHVLGRGDYRNKGEKVTPAVPSSLPPLPEDASRNRLGLAQWLVDPSHPLTARVAVNRYWQMYFGTGIVKTVEDFGSQGDVPAHPELLDWLATEFIERKWDVKAMQRLIVTSAAYRQSSKVSPQLVERDPENRLIARGPRFRLPAESVRDSALAISGLLNPEIGGPSVFPYQPAGIWEDVAYGDVYSAQSYTPSSGKDLYRRSMYTFWKRTAPPPSLATFDAPDREKCSARRPLTNTPLQALVLMNDPTYVEASRALAQRVLLEAPKSDAARVRFAYQAATGRSAVSKEVAVLRSLVSKQLSHYKRNPKAAEELLRIGESQYDRNLKPVELAAWTTVASAVLNLDETITKE